MEKARGKGLEESVIGRAGPLENITTSIVHIVHVQVCIIIVLSSYKVHAVLGCSSGLLILRDCGAIVLASHNDRSSRAVREASTVVAQ